MSDAAALVNMVELGRFRAELGANFARILGYFREDGIKSVEQIEAAMRAQSAAALVNPAHMLKGESRQFGAEPLADLAEEIEVIGRNCVERRDTPSDALEPVVQLRPLFEATLELLERESNPLVARRTAFGKRPALGYER
ncbi:Hpt domain-containing protein [Sphingosinithalassobacter portus]|uniref:Hpt domain-containing protein n=1 Tax=Stakelama portus TaxID=2676234 RepID=UPI000D6E359A|nr:Hpt domain-containing protein [Sphingosinithalassobacter portus]